MQATTDFTQVSPTPQLNTYYILESLLDFQYQAKSADFAAIFGDAIGCHLWSEFCGRCACNALHLYGQLDGPNRRRFAQWLEGVSDA